MFLNFFKKEDFVRLYLLRLSKLISSFDKCTPKCPRCLQMRFLLISQANVSSKWVLTHAIENHLFLEMYICKASVSQNGVSVRFLIFGRSDIILKQTSQNIISVLIHLYLNILGVLLAQMIRMRNFMSKCLKIEVFVCFFWGEFILKLCLICA